MGPITFVEAMIDMFKKFPFAFSCVLILASALGAIFMAFAKS